MGFLGDLISLPIGVINAPIRVMEDLMSGEKTREDDRVFSKPLDSLKDELKKL